MSSSRFPRPRCKICGVEVYPGVLDTHMRNQHPDYLSWGRQQKKWVWLVLGSGAALVLLDALFLSFLNQILQYVIPAYLLGAVYLLIIQQVRKVREFRNDWMETHPYQNPVVSTQAGSEPTPVEPWPLGRIRRKDWLRLIFWMAVSAISVYLLFLIAKGGYTAPP